jgi:hypothetical protein
VKTTLIYFRSGDRGWGCRGVGGYLVGNSILDQVDIMGDAICDFSRA